MSHRILYCHCAYAQVVPPAVKEAVLRKLCESNIAFDAVTDLCELSARRDPSLPQLSDGSLKIVACYPRAVKWLFAAANAPLSPDKTEILNMRNGTAEEICSRLLAEDLKPNLPAKGDMAPSPATPEAQPVAS